MEGGGLISLHNVSRATPPYGGAVILLRLLRERQANNTTLSGFYLIHPTLEKPQFLCWCLEDKIRAVKIAKETAIPTGTYPIRFRKVGRLHERYRQRFFYHQGMLEICELPNFKFVMFHIGNDKEDTEGCPLIGDEYDIINGEFVVKNSTVTYAKVYQRIADLLARGYRVNVEIINSPTIKVF